MSFWQMSICGAVMILAIIVVRALTVNRVPKKTFLVLWGAALVRLLVPFSLPSGTSIYSLLGASTAAAALLRGVPGRAASAGALTVVGQSTAAGVLSGQSVPAAGSFAAESAVTASSAAAALGSATSIWAILCIIWLVGAVLCAVAFAVAYWKCYREFQMSLPVENDAVRRWLQAHPLRRTVSVRQSDCIDSPLTFGVLHPVILMPKKTDWKNENALKYILEHEFIHIRRFDTVSKLLLIAAVCMHWFNPMVWAMYVLANRDLELSCDEAVVRHFGTETRACYARVLICMEEKKSGFAPLCNHFSKNAMKERITAIMKTKKTTKISIVAAAVLVAGIVAVFATSERSKASAATAQAAEVAATMDESSIMSYVNPDDGKTYYSFDEGKTFEPLTDAEFAERFPGADVEWWTYDGYKKWLDQEKINLQDMLGETGWTSGEGNFTWTQDKIDETIAMYEEVLEEIKNGTLYSKTIDGEDNIVLSYSAEDIQQNTEGDAVENSAD